MSRVTATTRSNSKLPDLVELFLSRPLVTVPLGAKLLKVTPKAIDLMLAQLGGALPRELTCRTRYRAHGASCRGSAAQSAHLNAGVLRVPLLRASMPLETGAAGRRWSIP